VSPAGRLLLAAAALALATPAVAGPRALNPLDGRPDAIVDLATREGAGLVRGQWRYSDVRIVETDFRAPGPDLRPSGAPLKTLDYAPRAGGADFENPIRRFAHLDDAPCVIAGGDEMQAGHLGDGMA